MFSRPSKVKRRRKHGYLSRKRTQRGKNLLKRRRQIGRKKLAV